MVLQEFEIKKIIKELACGLLYLHGVSIAHRDIKLENIVVNEDLSIVKYIDFGLCIDMSEKSKKVSS
jgi:serine/threonine protein kinase